MITRRSLLLLVPSSLAVERAVAQTKSRTPKAKPLPTVGEFVRFTDPATENPVVRLTDPRSESILPGATNRFVSSRERFVIFSSNRNGAFAPFQVDLRTGQLRQLTESTELQVRSLSLDERERVLRFVEGDRLVELSLPKNNGAAKKPDTLLDGVTSFSSNGAAGSGLFVVRAGKLEQLAAGKAKTLAENVAPTAEAGEASCWARPNGGGCLFLRQPAEDREFWYVDGRPPVLLAKGKISHPFWAADGQSVVFLRDMPGNNAMVAEIHEAPVAADGTPGPETFVCPTSQFACFAPNGDGSVFIGASRGKAQPDIVLLLRASRREMTLCEHRASRPNTVSPVFSPDSRRVYFESDRHGKTAIYSVNVELLIEPLPVNS